MTDRPATRVNTGDAPRIVPSKLLGSSYRVLGLNPETEPMNRRERTTRTDGLRLVKRATRWFVAASVAGTGLFAGVAAATTRTKTHQKTSAVTPTTSSSQSASTATTEPSDDDQLQAPATAPIHSNSQPAVTSGGS